MAAQAPSARLDRADGARRRPHARRNVGALEGRSGRRRSAQQPFARADDNFAVRAQVDQAKQRLAPDHLGGHHARQHIGADEAAHAGQEAHRRIARQAPSEFAGAKPNQAVVFRFEGIARQRRDVDAAKEVMHRGIADDGDAFERLAAGVLVAQLAQHRADGPADGLAQLGGALAPLGEGNAAHHIGAALGLGIERRAHIEHMAFFQIQQLRRQGRSAQIDRRRQPVAHGEIERRLVGQNRGFPLRQFDRQVHLGGTAASQAPALGQIGQRKGLLLPGVDGQAAAQDFNPAGAAMPPASAGKLDSIAIQRVLERCPAGAFDNFPGRAQFDSDSFAHERDTAFSCGNCAPPNAARPSMQKGRLCGPACPCREYAFRPPARRDSRARWNCRM
ncbi:MAG: hypothetical protein BWZ10_01201 [candidate division BRC1 bacterium ADurb.BinA364]|nr:MAG: hypothetical protein BWZ10_01201 [candidate division BRC1 bacterium ADurb.BinA364]